MESFINFKLEEWLLKGDGLDSVEVQNMDYVLEFDEFVRSIKQNMDTKFSMFLGAGASVESGVPSAGECIWEWKRDIFISKNPVLAETHNNIKSEQVKRSIQNWLDNQGIYPQLNSEEEYSKYIEAAYKIADDRRKYFQHLIEGKCPSLGYHIIALLAENEIVKSVWTTNFDGLMLKTAHSYGLVPIEVTLESQDRIFRNDTDKELLCIALHGDYKYGPLKNTEMELDNQSEVLVRALTHEIEKRNFIVLGYSGRDNSVMDALERAYMGKGAGRIYWCGYGRDIPPKVQRFLEKINQSGRNAFYVPTDGFDKTMLNIANIFIENEELQKKTELVRRVFCLAKQIPTKKYLDKLFNNIILDLQPNSNFISDENKTEKNGLLNTKESRKLENFEEFINSIKIEKNAIDALYFKSKKIGFYGRDKEILKLKQFLNENSSILLYTVCGEAGIGKSKLVYSFFEEQQKKKNWKMIFCDYPTFKRLITYNNYAYKDNLCIAIDNVGKVSVEFSEWLAFILQLTEEKLPPKLRIILIEREGLYIENFKRHIPTWYRAICETIGYEALERMTFKNSLDFGFMQINGLNKKNILKIMRDYINNSYDDVDCELDLEQYLQQEKNETINPLYAIMKIDISFGNQNDVQTIFFDNVDICLHQISKDDKVLYDYLQILILYVTIVEPWQIGKEEELPEFMKQIIYYFLDNIEDGELEKFVCKINKKEIFDGCLLGIEPDLVGESVVLEYMRRKCIHKRRMQKLLRDIMLNKTIEFVYFMTKCFSDFDKGLFYDITDKIGDSLRNISREIKFPVNDCILNKKYIHKMEIVHFLKKIGVAPGFDNKTIFKTELMRMLIEEKPCVMFERKITTDMMYSIFLLRESQRNENDFAINPVYLEKVVPMMKDWGFSEIVCEIVRNSSIFVMRKKSIESFIVSLVDILGELLLNNDRRKGYSVDKALQYIIVKVLPLNEDEERVKEIFVDFVVKCERLNLKKIKKISIEEIVI